MAKMKTFRRFDVITISIVHHIHDIYTSFLAPIMPLLIDKLSINYSLSGFLYVAQRIPTILNPFIGMLADKFRVRYLIIISPTLTAISMSLLGVAPGYTFLVILLLISGISSSFFHIPTPVMVKKVSGNEIGKGMSYFMLGGELARTVGPIVILGVVSLWGLEGSFKLVPFGFVASFILFIRIRKIEIRKDFETKREKGEFLKSFKNFLPVFSTMAGITFFRGAMKSSLTLYLPTFLDFHGESIWFSGIALSVVQLAGAAGTFMAGPISDKIGRRNTLLISLIVAPLLMFLFLHIKGVFIFPVLILTGIFLFFPGPVMLAAVHDFDTKHGAFVNGIYFGLNFLLNSITILLVGFFSDLFGMDIVYKFSVFWALLAIPFVIRFKENNH